jgi:excisionase family DNA binding protein
MAFRHKREDEAQLNRWLEVDASMTGSLTFKDPVNLQINGRFDGTLEAKGNLAIGEKADIRATMTGESIMIGGTVAGEITATRRLELRASARVTGKLSSPRIIMHEGAIFNGTIEMGAAASPPWMTVEELARFLEMDAETLLGWAQSGRLPAEQVNGQWRFERAKIEEWLAREKIKEP